MQRCSDINYVKPGADGEGFKIDQLNKIGLAKLIAHTLGTLCAAIWTGKGRV